MLKRLFDLCAVLVLLVLVFPLMVIVGLSVRVYLGKPILFSQVRPGYKGKPFKVYKFRSMTDAKDASGNLLPDDIRLTSFGQFLRRSSLDELPQLINVLRGDISLVGPRPLLMEYLPLYSSEQMRRHDVKPGITGWAQINGRNAITWDEKFKLDIWYVDHFSFWLDLKILFLTFKKVVKKEGISAQGVVTMPRFMGNQLGNKK